MTGITLLQSVAVASGLGVLTHLGYFIRGEHHTQGIYILTTAALFPWISLYSLWHYADFSVLRAAAYSFAIEWSFVISLWTSMLVYRIFFHPLKKFPGPLMAKPSKLWHSIQASKLRWYKDAWDLHAQYGEYVRTGMSDSVWTFQQLTPPGPNEVSIADPDSIDLIHGARTSCKKSAWYDLDYPHKSLQSSRDKAEHDKRRRVAWERAFSAKALRGYDSIVTLHADELIEGITKFDGKPVNVSKWFNYYTADTMSALGFGTPFNMLKTAEEHWTITVLSEGSKVLATLGPVPWVLPILSWFPFLAKANYEAKDWAIAQIEERKKRKVEEGKDIMAWLLDPLEPMDVDPKKEVDWLHSDARLAIVAGTDTSTAVLTYVSYYLARNSELTKKIRKELLDHGIDNDFSIHELQNCEYLQSIIDETMRLHPPVPDGVYRLTPPEGLQIGDHFIPGNVTIINPTYTVQRCKLQFFNGGRL